MLNIALCDDEERFRQQIQQFLIRYETETGEKINISSFSSGEDLLTHFPHETDILLLDIEMERPNGLETARRLRATVPDLCIIFITGYAQYALKSYSVRAFGFLPKPVAYSVLKNELNLAVTQLRRRSSRYVLIKDRENDTLHQLDVRDIYYFEVKDHDVIAVTSEKVFHYRGTMNTLEQELAENGFFRCHASYLVNQRYISSVNQDVILTDGTVIPISRPRRKAFLQRLADYVGEML